MKPRHYLTDSDLEKIRHMIEVEQLQQWKVADEIGVHVGTIEKVCRKLGLQTQRTGPKSGPEHPDWKGGRVMCKGYWQVYCPGHPYAKKNVPYVAEHRLVMEKKLGRYLMPGEVVHHLDSDPGNNNPENLMLFGSNAAHLKAELTGRCPNWTPEGRQRTIEGWKRYDTERHRKVEDGQDLSQSIGHPTE